jgi:hypothetical protein
MPVQPWLAGLFYNSQDLKLKKKKKKKSKNPASDNASDQE